MKLLVLMALISVSLMSCKDEKVVPASDLPSEINSYIESHFSSYPVVQVIKDNDGFKHSFDVTLRDGYHLEFDSKNRIVDIEGMQRLPDTVIPEKLLQYVSLNYPSGFVICWELDNLNQQIKLDSHIELIFNMDGDFLRIDY